MSYSSEFNLNKKKCLSCQHYSGCHGVSGGFMGDRIEYEQKGVCDRNGTKYLQSTTATDWCSKWVCDSRISLAISKKHKGRLNLSNVKLGAINEKKAEGSNVHWKTKEMKSRKRGSV